jgi:hypothetical protein
MAKITKCADTGDLAHAADFLKVHFGEGFIEKHPEVAAHFMAAFANTAAIEYVGDQLNRLADAAEAAVDTAQDALATV